MEKVVNALKQWLKANQITQQAIADRLGKSQPHIAMLISGKSNFGKKAAREWADAFGFSYSFLITGEGTLFDNDESLIVEGAKEYLDATASGDAESADYWKQKYDAAVLELQAERGKVEGLRIALESLRTAAIPHA